MRRLLVAVGVVVTVAALAVWCLLPAPPAHFRDVKIAQFGDLLLYMPLYIADDAGLFSKRGLEVTIVSTGGDDKTYAAVLSGSAQFGIADPTFVAIAHDRGQTGKVVALLIDGVPNYGVATSSEAIRIESPSDLAGKTVATVPAPSTSYALVRNLYAGAGIEPSIHQVAASGLIPSLTAGQADYALLIEPWVSAVVRQGGIVAFSLVDYYRHFALTGVTASNEMLEERADVTQAVIEALIEATQIYYSDPQRALEVAQRRFPGEQRGDLEAGLARMRADRVYPSDLRMTAEAWAPAIALRFELGDLQNAPGPMDTYVDVDFATAAYRKAGSEH